MESDVRDFSHERLRISPPIHSGDWYNARQVEDTVSSLNELAGTFGYAFADVRSRFDRSRDNLTMGVTFEVAESPRVYVERIDISGDTTARDKVIRREFRLTEGDPFNNVRIRRSRDRIQSLGFFRDNLELGQTQGPAPDRVVLGVDVVERATGNLQLSAGFSSIEHFLVKLAARQRNFMGSGQELRASVNYSSYSKSAELGFTEPDQFDRNVATGFDVFRRDWSSFNFEDSGPQTVDREAPFERTIRAGVPLADELRLALRYDLDFEDVSLAGAADNLERNRPDQILSQSVAGRYLCDPIGQRVTSTLSHSLMRDALGDRLRRAMPVQAASNWNPQDLDIDVRRLRTSINGARYWRLLGAALRSVSAEAGYVHSFEADTADLEPVRLTDRFFLGNPQSSGVDLRGLRPIADNEIGGRAYYLARAELEIPSGSSAGELGLRRSVFDVGAIFGPRLGADRDPGELKTQQQPIHSARGDLTDVPTPTGLRTSGIRANRPGGMEWHALGNGRS